MKRSVPVLAIVILLTTSELSLAAPDVVACDLLSEAAISDLAGTRMKANINRERQLHDGARISNCMFRADRQIVIVTLMEYPSGAEALKSYDAGRKDAAQAKRIDNVVIQYSVEDVANLGEKAYWYRLASEQSGLSAVKGSRVMNMNFQFHDSATGAQVIPRLKDRLRSSAMAAIRQL